MRLAPDHVSAEIEDSMSTIDVAAPATGSLSATKGAGRDRAFRYLSLGAGCLVLLILLAIVLSTTIKAWPVFASQGLSYFTGRSFNQTTGEYGILAYVYGTVVVS